MRKSGTITAEAIDDFSAAVVATQLEGNQHTNQGVLGYIANKDKRPHPFVANRVAAIEEVTSSTQWKHVGTKQNPADDASRGRSADALLKNECWLTGPNFLWKTGEAWPSQQFTVSTVSDEDPEVRRESQVFGTKADAEVRTVNKLFEYFSQWFRLKKFVAWMLRYQANLQLAVRHRTSGSLPTNQHARIIPISGK